MSVRIAVDTGGTFTDVVVTDESGEVWAAKASTTPDDVFDGVGAAIERAAAQAGLGLDELLARCGVLSYATTHATNAILLRRTARTAFVTTWGHPDVLVLKEGGKFGPFDFSRDHPEPYVPRALTFEVRERIGAGGEVVEPLDERDAVRVIGELERAGVEAVGVCFLWAHVHPAHERRFAELLAERLPDVAVSVSHAVVPTIREYRRASATCIDASLKPLMTRHFESVERRLLERGFGGDFLVVTSTGGVVPAAEVIRRPLLVVSSGPSIAPVGAEAAAREAGVDDADLVVGDMGGTTFDISLVRDGEAQFARETWLGDQFTGDITGLASVAVESIGYGGGSIAWIDDGGMLRVGPASAGAAPGPACYGRGGSDPTFTDAAVVCGLLDPDAFLGGQMRLDAGAAHAAVARGVAEPLGLTAEEAAAAIVEVAVDGMAERIRELTARDGLDLADAVFVAGGGASALCAGAIGQRLGCRSVLVPRLAPVLSAAGGLCSDVLMEFAASHPTATDAFDFDGVTGVLDGLDGEMERFLRRLGADDERGSRQFIAEARYRHQVWELELALAGGGPRAAEDLPELEESFHRVHERAFGVRDPGQVVEVLYWRGRARAALDRPAPSPLAARETAAGTPSSAWFADAGLVETTRFDGERLAADAVIDGAAVVDLPHTTLVVPPGLRARRTALGHFVLTSMQQEEAR